MAITEQPVQFKADGDLNVENIALALRNIQDNLREIGQLLDTLQSASSDHETRITTLEAA